MQQLFVLFIAQNEYAWGNASFLSLHVDPEAAQRALADVRTFYPHEPLHGFAPEEVADGVMLVQARVCDELYEQVASVGGNLLTRDYDLQAGFHNDETTWHVFSREYKGDTFMAKMLRGEVSPEAVDDAVEDWHTQEAPATHLHHVLGLTLEEYSTFLAGRARIDEIALARRWRSIKPNVWTCRADLPALLEMGKTHDAGGDSLLVCLDVRGGILLRSESELQAMGYTLSNDCLDYFADAHLGVRVHKFKPSFA